jgi:predicted ATPase/transcriptional regulator with XRE-family HTH domain
MPKSQVALTTFNTFGELLKFLRRRARLTQRDLSIAVGYSEAQISRLETNQRSPEIAALKALFVPALGIDDEPEVIARLTELAAASHVPFDGEHGVEEVSRVGERDFLGENSVEFIGDSLKRTHNLPIQLTSFIGREKEISDVVQLLHSSRLVTIHGSGGTGKTRLCLEVAAQVQESYPDGAWLVELAPLTDKDKIPQLINTTLGLIASRSRSALDLLVDFLGNKRMLLLLDNCEHLIDACARLADRLLQACPQLTILASSREGLGVSGEITYRVPSLSIPETQQPIEKIVRFEAVRLFVERAASIHPGFLVTEANAQAVVQICRRLDGIPLAIELAAARMDLLSPEQIAARLDKRFRLLTGGSRTALPRQQTLRASIDWSYSLLAESERLLLQRLSVFTGGWTLDAAEAVCGFDELDDFEVLDGLGQLVKKSLVVTDSQAGVSVRYRLLETIRQYAREKLLDAGTGADVRTRHLNYYLELAEQAEPHLRGPDQVDWNDRLEAEIDNLRAALEWSGEDQVEKGLRIVGSLIWFWKTRMISKSGEIADWLDHTLTANPLGEEAQPQQVLVYAKALSFLASDFSISGKIGKKVVEFFEMSLCLYEKVDPVDRGGLVFLYHFWALNTLMSGGDHAQSQANYRKALSIAEELGDRFGIAECLPWIDWTDDLSEKIKIAQRGLALRREIGDLEGIWWDLFNLSRLYYAQSDYPQALQLNEEGMKICQQVKNRWGLSMLWNYQGLIYSDMGHFVEAISWVEQSLRIYLTEGDRYWGLVYELGLASILQKQGNVNASERQYRDTFDTARKEGYVNEQAVLRFSQGEIAWARGDYTIAEQNYRDVMTLGQEINSDSTALGMYGLGKIALALGERSAAWDQFHQAIQTWMRFGTKDYLSQVLEAMAVAVASPASGDPITNTAAIYAARLHGAGQAFNYFIRLVFFIRPHFESYDMDACLAPARAVLGEEAYARAYSEGQAMKLEQAVEYALNYEGN